MCMGGGSVWLLDFRDTYKYNQNIRIYVDTDTLTWVDVASSCLVLLWARCEWISKACTCTLYLVPLVDQRDAHTRDAHPPETRTDLDLASLKRSRLTDTITAHALGHRSSKSKSPSKPVESDEEIERRRGLHHPPKIKMKSIARRRSVRRRRRSLAAAVAGLAAVDSIHRVRGDSRSIHL